MLSSSTYPIEVSKSQLRETSVILTLIEDTSLGRSTEVSQI